MRRNHALCSSLGSWCLGIALSLHQLGAGCDEQTPRGATKARPERKRTESGAPPRGSAMDRAGRTADAGSPAPDVARAPAAPSFEQCMAAPAGMVCIPGGAFWRGSDAHGKDARPRSRVVVGTFYMDRHEVTTPVFTSCVQAGICKAPKEHLRYKGFHGPEQPAVPVSWFNALAICLMQGKRLPTEAEWEKAARTTDGRTYPWGEEPPTCARAHVQGCKPAVTRPVGSLPPNPYGLHDMAGNGYEWVMDWYSPCYAGCHDACGRDCDGPDPRGPCDGALRCPGRRRRVLRGGSWYWSGTHGRTVWRRPELPESGGHRLSLRCATRNHRPKTRDAQEVKALLLRLDTEPIQL
ncbi:MAG: SUMF1/EgtB/PvdO family nonheme iron enzyme [Polyangia bacterium]|jgi:formylglycine-generating enzyme required for sulfatase activity|nr:SUMF1/EgtB/PvdO family nonheme iron enzyme [Polyangia bacterium]